VHGDLWTRHADSLAAALWDGSPALSLLVDPATETILDARGPPLLGAPASELRGLALAALDPGENRNQAMLAFTPTVVHAPGVHGELYVLRRDGEPTVVSLEVYGLSAGMMLLRMRSVELQVRLAADLRRAHGQLQQAFRELQEQRRSLDEARRAASLSVFAAGLAHELNNPLGALMSTASALREYVEEVRASWVGERRPPELEELPQLANEIRACGQRVVTIVQRLREMERAFSPSRCDVMALVREVAERHAPVELHGPPQLEAETDGDAVVRLLGPVLDNARKASATGAPLRMHVEDGGEHVRVRVEDDGPGVPASLRERVFDPFFSTRPPGAGLGLGLFLARRAAAALGGEIALESPEAGGTRVVASFPRQARRSGELVSYEGLRTR
jgi:signal transduction histidine kinase